MVFLAVAKLKPEHPLFKAKLTLIRASSRECDYDGLVSSFKHIIDGLTQCGVLVDDSKDHIGIPDYRQIKAKINEGYVTIKVEEIEKAP